jgi:hypothetical protein
MSVYTDSGDGVTDSFSTGWTSSSLYETGYQSNEYTLNGASYGSFSNSEYDDSDADEYTLTTSRSDQSTYTRSGTDDSGNAFTIVQSDNNSGTVNTTGDDESGDYTATAIGSDTLTTDENISGPANSSTLHEVVSGSSTLTNIGNDYAGKFSTTHHEFNSTTLVQSGYNSEGTYALHESMTDSPVIYLWGNNIDGSQTISQTGTEHYSLSQTNDASSVTYTLTETGAKAYTITGSDAANTGDSTRTDTGTDAYTLTQTGTSDGEGFSIGVTGNDGYTTNTSSNSQSGAFSQTTTGSGTYTKTDLVESTTSAGSTNFSSQEIGSTRDGELVLTTSGTSRYDLLTSFNNTSDGGNGTAGLADFSPVGLPVLVTRMSVPAGIFSSIGDARYEYCFAAGTELRLSDGSRVRIDQAQVGQNVRAVNDADPLVAPGVGEIVRVYHNAPARLLHVTILGCTLRVTPNHPLYVKDRGWIAAEKLQPGDQLRTDQCEWAAVEAVRLSDEVEPVFNVQVRGGHTYFVLLPGSDVAVLAHNDSAVATPAQSGVTANSAVMSGPAGVTAGGTAGTSAANEQKAVTISTPADSLSSPSPDAPTMLWR